MMVRNDVTSVDVGRRLKELRAERRISLRALARASGLSANAVSMIERGKTSPSVSTLYKLADGLNIPVTAFFQSEVVKERIVFRNSQQRQQVSFPSGIWEGLGGEAFVGRVEPFMLTLEGGASSGPQAMVHTGHEFVMCLDGRLEYEVEGQYFNLEKGDSLLFAARLSHRWRNPGDAVTQALFVLSGFEEFERPGEDHY